VVNRFDYKPENVLIRLLLKKELSNLFITRGKMTIGILIFTILLWLIR
jgi:hypothetical protein